MVKNLTAWLEKSNTTSDTKPTKKSAPASAKKTNPQTSKTSKKAFPNGAKKGFRRAPEKHVKTNHDPNVGRPTTAKRTKNHPTNYLSPAPKAGAIRVVPLGGMEQVGENMMFIEWENDIIIIDTGLLFPSPEHLGVDVLIPDISYLIKNKSKIRGVIYTHGHLDHIGGVPYIIPELGFPQMFATKLTKELIFANSSEHGINKNLKINEINPKSKIKLGKFEIEFFHINHSIPDGVGIVVHTPYGSIVNSSDFKIDHSPSDEQPADLGRIASIGKQGVALAMVDSTNAMKSGHTMSEALIEEELDKIIRRTEKRLLITTFASSIGRVAKIVESAEKYGRTVFLSGRSMEKNIGIARKLNYLKCKDKTVQLMSKKAEAMDPSKVLILSTGSQGEELAALTRMAAGVHKHITLNPEDTIVFSSSPIPGNELAIVSVLNNLAEIGVKTIDKTQLDVYVSGHGHAEECKLMTTLLNPKYFAPIHGELYMRHGHRDLAMRELNFKKENTFIMKNGQGVVLSKSGARLMTDKEAIPCSDVMIELGEKVKEHVLSDRTMMADSGAIFIAIDHNGGTVKNIKIKSRGFRYMDLKNELFKLLEKELKGGFERIYDPARPEKAIEQALEKSTQRFFLQKCKKEPLVEVAI